MPRRTAPTPCGACNSAHPDRAHRHAVKLAAPEHLISDFEKTSDYHEAARELVSETKERDPKFTDKEINLEIYAERQNDEAEREKYLEFARGEPQSQVQDISTTRTR